MTMHLEKAYLTTNNTKSKKKKKLTENDIKKYQKDLKMHNKKMRQMHCHHMQMTLDQYIDYCNGKYKPKKAPRTENLDWRSTGGNTIIRKDNYPSYSGTTTGTCKKPEPKIYTGDKLVGIATMHKSNIIPVFKDENDKTGKKTATEISQMRRN